MAQAQADDAATRSTGHRTDSDADSNVPATKGTAAGPQANTQGTGSDSSPTTIDHAATNKTAQINNPPRTQAKGGVPAAATDQESPVVGISARESRAQATNRWIMEGRRWEVDRFRKDVIRQDVAAGLTKAAAGDHAWRAALAAFPPAGEEPETLAPPEQAGGEKPVARGESGQIQGLSDIPADWPELPANAGLQAEIGWVQANRLLIVKEKPGGATVVDLTRALEPAPSRAALGWLETSIRAYSKYVDIVARSLSTQVDEQQHVRRERVAIDEIRALLDEMYKD